MSPSEGMLLVRATIALHDGSRYRGFVTPAFKQGDLGALQPQIFVGDCRYRFWGGMFGVKPEDGRHSTKRLGNRRRQSFPCNSAPMSVSRQASQRVE